MYKISLYYADDQKYHVKLVESNVKTRYNYLDSRERISHVVNSINFCVNNDGPSSCCWRKNASSKKRTDLYTDYICGVYNVMKFEKN